MGKRKRHLFNPKSAEPFKLSRSKIEDYIRCPRCFYLDRRLGIAKPSIPGYTLNSAVDTLLKKEFDIHRLRQEAHPLMAKSGLAAVPFQHADLDRWRYNFHGIRWLHQPTNFLVFGAVDDLWINQANELLVVDYKSTSKSGEVTLDDQWKDGYKRQMEVYQWLLRQNGFKVNSTGYFLYANGRTDPAAFNQKLDFHLTLLPYQGDDRWVEPALRRARKCLESDQLPPYRRACEYCYYRRQSAQLEQITQPALQL